MSEEDRSSVKMCLPDLPAEMSARQWGAPSQYNLLPTDTVRVLNFLDMIRLWNMEDRFSQMKVSTY